MHCLLRCFKVDIVRNYKMESLPQYLTHSRALFLLERVHIVRAPFIAKRTRDPVWLIGAIITILGYTSITAWEFIAPKAELSRVDGLCRIGIQADASIAITVLDTVLNAALTGIFIWQMRHVLLSIAHPRSGHIFGGRLGILTSWVSCWPGTQKSALHPPGKMPTHFNLRVMLLRNFIGSALLMVNTIINNALYIRWSFAELSHACLLMCLTDSKYR